MRVLTFLLLVLTAPCGAAVNVNSATYTELIGLPGIGPKLAQAILDDHASRGDFKRASDLERVKGIGPAISARLASLIEFGEPSQPAAPSPDIHPPTRRVPQSCPPVDGPCGGEAVKVVAVGRRVRARRETAVPEEPLDLNAADAESLGRLPGLGGTLAKRIVEFRSAHGPFRTVAALARVKGVGPRRAAALARRVRVK